MNKVKDSAEEKNLSEFGVLIHSEFESFGFST